MEGLLSEFEDEWSTSRDSWTKEQWRRAAELAEKELNWFITKIEQLNIAPKKGPGRPRKLALQNVLTDAYWASIGGRPAKRRGRPRKYADEKWEMIYEVVELFRKEIESETGKKSTIKAAIEKLVGEWGLASRRSKQVQRTQVVRWQKLYSRAKEKIAKIEKN